MIGQQVLLYFAILLFIIYVTVYFGVRRKQERMFAVMACAWVVIIDQYVKRAVVQSLALGETAELLPGLLRLERVHNYGAAWSSFSGARWLLIGVTGLGLALLFWLVTTIVRHPLGVWSLWLVIGGGIGNLIDRVVNGYVVDMLATEFMNFPVFNIADIFVTCGTAAAALYYLKYYDKADAANWESRKRHGTDHPDNGNG